MRLFISYARVDKRYCEQIVRLLDIYDVWYDQRLHVGQRWWEAIVNQLEQCDGFVYLLSPESIASEYCQREFQIANRLNKHIFPILIQPRLEIPDYLKDFQCADLSQGLDAESVKNLLGAIYLAGRKPTPQIDERKEKTIPTRDFREPATGNDVQMLEKIAIAFDEQDYDKAVFLLKQFKKSGFSSRFIDLEKMLSEAEGALEEQAYLRAAEREYEPIRVLVQHSQTRNMGLQAFDVFQREFPDFDPDNLSQWAKSTHTRRLTNVFDSFDWCEIPGGEVINSFSNGSQAYQHVGNFYISRYPVTNKQFQAFIDAPDGYNCEQWWHYSEDAYQWHYANPKPLPRQFPDDDNPSHNLCWYEAIAFCHWLTNQADVTISLPSESEWQRAAQGHDDRVYPWGNDFHQRKCNTKENHLRRLTSTRFYTANVSPFGVCDMVGNVWEWCSNGYKKVNNDEEEIHRAMKGGSFMTPAQRSVIASTQYLKPNYRYSSIGFRIVHRIKY